jgi:hypothetical protein
MSCSDQENPNKDDLQALGRALDMLNNNGALSEIALLLESCLSSHTTAEQVSNLSIDGLQDKPGSMEAKIKAGGEAAVWTLLGMVQAMDEKEAAAVRALEEGRKRFEAMGSKRNGPGGERSKLGDVMMGEGLVVSLRRIWSDQLVRVRILTGESEPGVGNLIYERIL